ncbi:hypothetical protein, partial [Cyanobium sp. FACHB-13342]|uniref:hypothetical protein n=1 Tax=Cyanobium sp. FACHB-13342 TaxID=2692793 RepID=UPI0018F01F61
IFASSNSSRTGFWIQSPVSDARTELFLDLGTAETTGDGYFIINAFTLSNGTIQFATPNDGLGGRDLYFGYAIDTSTSVVDPNIDLDNNINSGVWQISPNPAYGGTFFSGTSGLISTYLPIFDQAYSSNNVLFGYSQIKSRKGYAITLDTPAATPFFISNSTGAIYSDASTASWDAKGARAFGTGYQVLLDGTGTYAGKGLVWTTNSAGVITGSSGWLSAERLWQWESAFGVELNDDGTTGYAAVDVVGGRLVRPIGAVYGGTYYIDRDGDGDTDDLLKLRNSEGVSYRDSSSGSWDAKGARAFGTGYQVLLDGTGTYAGKGLVWTTNSAGVITGSSGWLSAERLWQWESAFGVELNDDGTTGYAAVDVVGGRLVRPIGAVYGGTYYIDRDGDVDTDDLLKLRNRDGVSYRDSSSGSWDAKGARAFGTGYQVLLDGTGAYEGQGLVWTTNSAGVITGSSGWLSAERLWQWESAFGVELNNDGSLGDPKRSEAPLDFAKHFWSVIALSYAFSGIGFEADTQRSTTSPIAQYVETFKNELVDISEISINSLKFSSSYSEKAIDYGYFEEYAVAENFSMGLFIDGDIRWSFYGADDNTLWAGNPDSYEKLKSLELAASPGDAPYLYGGKAYEFIAMLNEQNLFSSSGFKTISRAAADLLSDKSLYREYDCLFPSEEKSDIARSFMVRQTSSIETWLSDGIFLADTNQTSYNNYEDSSFSSYSASFLFTLSGVLLGTYEEDYEYKYYLPEDQYRSVEFGNIFYNQNSLGTQSIEQLKAVFPSEVSAILKAQQPSPIFVGYEGAQLGFDWLTGLPSSNVAEEVELVALIGADAAVFNPNQVYIALEDCDIMTGNGFDLIILADDVNNADANSVPTILDFNSSNDKILLPIDTFSGLSEGNPGIINPNLLAFGKDADTASQRIIYDATIGHLYYDSDGNGSGSKELLAYFLDNPVLTANNFLLG